MVIHGILLFWLPDICLCNSIHSIFCLRLISICRSSLFFLQSAVAGPLTMAMPMMTVSMAVANPMAMMVIHGILLFWLTEIRLCNSIYSIFRLRLITICRCSLTFLQTAVARVVPV